MIRRYVYVVSFNEEKVRPKLVFRRYSKRIPAQTPAIQAEVFRGFPRSLEANGGIVPRLGNGHFYPINYSPFILQFDAILSAILYGVRF
jgi:hypothetical protein